MAFIDTGTYSGPLPDPNTDNILMNLPPNGLVFGELKLSNEIKICFGDEEITFNLKELKRIKELLLKEFPEDYI